MIKIAIFGFGSVGQGVAEVLLNKGDFLRKIIGDFKVVAVTDSKGGLADENGIDLAKALEIKRKRKRLPDGVTTMDVIENMDFDVGIEVTVTNIEHGEPGLTHIKECLRKGSNVITSNKGPLVVAYKELAKLAEKIGVQLCLKQPLAVQCR